MYTDIKQQRQLSSKFLGHNLFIVEINEALMLQKILGRTINYERPFERR